MLAYFQQRYKYFCVDESQDTSKIQHEIIRLLAGRSLNLFMVGDEDQSIYGFRAAYPQALMDFEQVYPGAQVLLMEENYRSSEEIVAAANAFVARSRYRRPKPCGRPRGRSAPLIYGASPGARSRSTGCLRKPGAAAGRRRCCSATTRVRCRWWTCASGGVCPTALKRPT